MKLETPSIDYAGSYDRYIKELGAEERYPFPLDFEYSDFSHYLRRLEELSTGKNVPKGFVQSSTWWLVEENEIVGITNLRHQLTPELKACGGHIGLSIRPSRRGQSLGKKLMSLSIEKLRHFGVTDIHIHCYKGNLSSANTILACGGVLHSELQQNHQTIQRYIVV